MFGCEWDALEDDALRVEKSLPIADESHSDDSSCDQGNNDQHNEKQSPHLVFHVNTRGRS